MSSLAGLLGQDVIAERLIGDLDQSEVKAVRLTGPAGSGKSHVARLAASKWREGGGTCVVAVGDDDHAWRELYPLLSGLAWAHADWVGLAETGTRTVLRLADSTLVGAGVGTSIFDLLSAALRQRTERALRPYSSLEREVLLDVKRLARSRPLLLIADNAHWWDADSLRLLGELLSEPLRAAIPQLASVVVLLVDTAGEQPVVAPAPFDAMVAKHISATHTTMRCTGAQFPHVLEAFGLRQRLPDDVLRALFSATNGHLKLAEQVAAYAEHQSVRGLLDAVDRGYLSALVSARFSSLGSFSPEVTTLLVRAAVLGLTFTEKDLVCITETREALLRPLVEHAEAIGFIEREADRIVFTHDVIRAAILDDQSASRLQTLYAKLSDCLAILRPGDYAARGQALLQAGEHERMREMLALSAVSQLRSGVSPARALSRVVLQLPQDGQMIVYLETLAEGYACVGAGDYTRSLPRLLTPMPSETMLMAAERNYLAALCSMELGTAAGFTDAQTILSSWAPQVEQEVELGMRFLILLQQAQALSESFDEARSTEKKIEQQLLRRSRYDIDAAVLLQVQNRRAGAVNTPEVAETRIHEAVRFFERGTGNPIKDRRDLFCSLTNLSAIQIRLGKEADALVRARQAEQIALDAPDLLSRLDVLASNIVLAAYRCNEIDIAEAAARQRTIIDSPEGSGDKFIHRCNLVAYLLLGGQDDDAVAQVDALHHELMAGEIEEPYHRYYCNVLRVAAAAVCGDTQTAIERHRALDDFVASLKWPSAPYIRRRHLLLVELLPSVQADADRSAMDRILLDTHPLEVGGAWAYYGRLIPCCELSLWRDS
ncbi:MAG: ATPase [Conexibacter sp.]|nr:ATPase [Conexibacter sp.]